MANPDHVAVVKSGAEAIAGWRKENPEKRMDLVDANLRRANLTHANLTRADLNGANLRRANLTHANLTRADLSGADLIRADLGRANLISTDLTSADLTSADLSFADLSDAHLIRSNLSGTDLTGADLRGTDLSGAGLWDTVIYRVDLTNVIGLDESKHIGPSCVSIDVLKRLQGNVTPEIETFLRYSGLEPWEIEFAKLYDPDLTGPEVAELVSTTLFDQRTAGPMYLGGIFISYSHEDSKFVDKLRQRLIDANAVVWLDRHDATTGNLERQVAKAIREHDIVLMVLSKDSIDSEWVEHELMMALGKEEKENRDVLAPIAIDDSWLTKSEGSFLWGKVRDKLVLDFSKWRTKAFEAPFRKLVTGLKLNYPGEPSGDE